MKKIKGKYLQIRVDGHTIALSTNCSFQTTTQYSSDSKTKDEAMGPSSGDAEWVDWTMSCDSLVGVSSASQLTEAKLRRLQLQLKEVDIECFLAANGDAKVPEGDWVPETPEALEQAGFSRWGGKATIESINTGAPAEGKASFSVSFKAASVLAEITE